MGAPAGDQITLPFP